MKNTQKHSDDVRRMIGYLPQELNMYPSLSVLDFVSYIVVIPCPMLFTGET